MESTTFNFWPYLERFARQPVQARWVFLVTLVALIGVLDFMSGYEASLAVLYVIPVFVAAWSLGLVPGLIFALLASSTLILTNWLAGQHYSEAWIMLWNILVRGGTFAVVAALVASLHGQLRSVRQMSLTDPLTGAWNRRAFYQEVATELARIERSPAPLSLAYIDLDNFKAINDGKGHEVGDQVLKSFAQAGRRSLRLQDMLARMGGDEFAILLPGTDQEAMESVLTRLVVALKSATRHVAPVTFSIGALTFVEPPPCVNGALRLADDLMYQVKNGGKDNIMFASYPDYAPKKQT